MESTALAFIAEYRITSTADLTAENAMLGTNCGQLECERIVHRADLRKVTAENEALRDTLSACSHNLDLADDKIAALRARVAELEGQVRKFDNATSLFSQLRTTIMVRFDGLKDGDRDFWLSINGAFDKLASARALNTSQGEVR